MGGREWKGVGWIAQREGCRGFGDEWEWRVEGWELEEREREREEGGRGRRR